MSGNCNYPNFSGSTSQAVPTYTEAVYTKTTNLVACNASIRNLSTSNVAISTLTLERLVVERSEGSDPPENGKIVAIDGDVFISGVIDPTGLQLYAPPEGGRPRRKDGSDAEYSNTSTQGLVYLKQEHPGGTFSNSLVFLDGDNTEHALGDMFGPEEVPLANAVARFDGTSGKQLAGGTVTLSDDNKFTAVGGGGDIGLYAEEPSGAVTIQGDKINLNGNVNVNGSPLSGGGGGGKLNTYIFSKVGPIGPDGNIVYISDVSVSAVGGSTWTQPNGFPTEMRVIRLATATPSYLACKGMNSLGADIGQVATITPSISMNLNNRQTALSDAGNAAVGACGAVVLPGAGNRIFLVGAGAFSAQTVYGVLSNDNTGIGWGASFTIAGPTTPWYSNQRWDPITLPTTNYLALPLRTSGGILSMYYSSSPTGGPFVAATIDTATDAQDPRAISLAGTGYPAVAYVKGGQVYFAYSNNGTAAAGTWVTSNIGGNPGTNLILAKLPDGKPVVGYRNSTGGISTLTAAAADGSGPWVNRELMASGADFVNMVVQDDSDTLIFTFVGADPSVVQGLFAPSNSDEGFVQNLYSITLGDMQPAGLADYPEEAGFISITWQNNPTRYHEAFRVIPTYTSTLDVNYIDSAGLRLEGLLKSLKDLRGTLIISNYDNGTSNIIHLSDAVFTENPGHLTIDLDYLIAMENNPDGSEVAIFYQTSGFSSVLNFGRSMAATSISATAGARALPASPEAFLPLVYNGVSYKIALYNP